MKLVGNVIKFVFFFLCKTCILVCFGYHTLHKLNHWLLYGLKFLPCTFESLSLPICFSLYLKCDSTLTLAMSSHPFLFSRKAFSHIFHFFPLTKPISISSKFPWFFVRASNPVHTDLASLYLGCSFPRLGLYEGRTHNTVTFG